jgi:asparagine synthetase A
MHDLHETVRIWQNMEEKGNWDSKGFSKLMKDSKNELVDLQNELNNVMMKFCLRALRVYQSTRQEPLRPSEIALLIKNELNNVIADLTPQSNLDNITKAVKEEWIKEQKQ